MRRRTALVFVLALVGCNFHLNSGAPGGGGGGGPMIDAPTIDAPTPPTSPRKLLFDNSAQSTTLGNGVPILVALDATKIDYSKVANPLTDLKFVDLASTGTALPFDVDRWDPTGESIVWVSFPQLNPHTTTQGMYMHFGPNSGMADPAGIWSMYDMVLHFEAPFADSSGAFYEPITTTNVATAAGQLGDGAHFDGSNNELVNFTSAGNAFDGWNGYSIEFWIYPDYASLADVPSDRYFLDKGGSIELGRVFPDSGALAVQIDAHFTGGNDAYVLTHIPLRAWSYIAYSFDGQHLRMYRDGAQVNEFTTNNLSFQTLVSSANGFYLGHSSSTFTGMLDELRTAQNPHSGDWWNVQHLSMTRQFVSFHDPP